MVPKSEIKKNAQKDNYHICGRLLLCGTSSRFQVSSSFNPNSPFRLLDKHRSFVGWAHVSGTGKLSKQLKYRDEVSERKVNVN